MSETAHLQAERKGMGLPTVADCHWLASFSVEVNDFKAWRQAECCFTRSLEASSWVPLEQFMVPLIERIQYKGQSWIIGG